jgi:two-component system sensor histidine kinase QseC
MAIPKYWNLTLPNGRPGRAVGLRYVPHADRHDRKRNFDPDLSIDLVVAEDVSDLLQALATIRTSLWMADVLGFLAAAVLIRRVVRRELHALKFVGDRASSISADTLHLRFPEGNMPVEMKPICERLNQLLGRLENSFERERQFSSDIAHELRTPIAELRSYAELHLKWPDQPAGRFPAEALKIALQMESLVQHLMLLARCDQEQLPVRQERFNLEDVIRQSLSAYREPAERRGLRMTARTMDLWLTTDRALVVAIVNNLVGNAVEYSPSQVEVHIDVTAGVDRFEVTIRNPAPDLTPEQEERLFDRFWRSDTARSSHEHFGLGLPLSRALADRVGYRLTSRLLDGTLTLSLTGALP